MPAMESDLQAIEAILTLAPESNGVTSRKAWKALEKPTGLDLKHLTEEGRYTDPVRRSGTAAPAGA